MPPIPFSPSHPPEAILGSRVPPAPVDALKDVEALIGRLRTEVAGATEGSRKARLLCEIGELEERSGDETSAARDYLAAFNADGRFREPVESLLRLLVRRRSLRNLGKIVEALARMAETPDEKARAHVLRAFFYEDVGADVNAGKRAATEATEVEGASRTEAAAAWLTLEMFAAKVGDEETRARALGKRPAFTDDPTWRALLLLDSAREAARAGDMDRALACLAQAKGEGAGASFAVAIAEERLTRTEVAGADEESRATQARAFASALETQAALVEEALASPARGDALGVPRWARTPTAMVDAWLRAADARAFRGNDLASAAALLDRAREAIARFETGEPALAGAVIDARIRVAERTGDTALAAELADARLGHATNEDVARAIPREDDGGAAAALAMRVAEHAASEGDVARALGALSIAVERDPASVPARALQLDLLADDDPAAFAVQLEALADHLPTDEGRARALTLAAWVLGTRTSDTAAARAALVQAGVAGADPQLVARVARAIASLARDASWYEEATRRLIVALADEDPERASLHFELARLRFERRDDTGARKSLRDLGATAQGAWLGRAIEAFLPAEAESAARAREALDELAARPQANDVARGLVFMAALRAHRAGDVQGARARLRDLLDKRGDDVLVATYLSEVERSSGAIDEVARVTEQCAASIDDAELSGALRIEAALARWRQGDREGAIGALERAIDSVPDAARAVLAWAARGVDVDSLPARRTAIARGLDGGGDDATLLLERFAVELAANEPSDARAALASVESVGIPEIVLAACLARVAWSGGDDDAEALDVALARLATAGPEAKILVTAETYRRARESGETDVALESARGWFHANGGLTAGVEWLAAAMNARAPAEESAARRALVPLVPHELREALLVSAAMLDSVADPMTSAPLLVGESDAVRLMNLELAPPGCDPRRRIAALTDLGNAIGPDADADASSLAGWSWLVEGNAAEAMLAFEKAVAAHADDISAWEGIRAAALATGDLERRASACEALGALCRDDPRSALFWEEAGRAWLDLKDEVRGENALDAAFARDAHRAFAFDKVFRRIRERKDGERLLEVVARRLAVSDDPTEIAKLFWEQARVLRERGEQEAALRALENVTMLEPDHVGALALTGEIAIKRGQFQEAADALARLALLDEAPGKNRLTAGVAAVDLFENKLNRFDRALEILLVLHRAKLSNLPVRERLARAAARTGSWKEATEILEELMFERVESEGRVEAARLAMAIHRDRLNDLQGAKRAVVKLLEEAPIDGEAIDVLLAMEVEPDVRARLLEHARATLVETIQRRPTDLPLSKRLARVARAQGDEALQQIALASAIVLAGHDANLEQQYAAIAAKKPRTPQIALTEAVLKQVLDPGDRGPVAKLFAALGPTIAEALGPSLAGCGVTKKDKIDPRSGISLRNEIAAWAGAFGVLEFDLYVGGKDPLGVQGVPGEPPALVVGAGVNAPLAPATRARVARELLAMVRGSTIVRHRDETTIAAIVVAACNLAEVRVDAPSYAVLADVERLLSKALARKTKKLLPELCQAVAASSADARAWSKRALASHARVAALASGDVAIALSDALGEPSEKLSGLAKTEPRAEELLRFVLSPVYVELRRALGLEPPATAGSKGGAA